MTVVTGFLLGVTTLCVLLSIAGYIWLLRAAFQQSLLWGIGCLFPVVTVVFLVMHTRDSWKPFLLTYLPLIAALLLLASPALKAAHVNAQQIACMNRLVSIGKELQAYDLKHGSGYPGALADLAEEGKLGEDGFKCPAAQGTGEYIYLPGLAMDAPSGAVVLYDHRTNHPDGRNVLFADGHVEFVMEKSFLILLESMTGPEYEEYYPADTLQFIRRELEEHQ
jgi:prepilin-type processing-associated H-X9-DG protein